MALCEWRTPLHRYPVYLVGVYLACDLIANITAAKITTLGPFSIPAAVYIFTLTYTLLDLINYALGPAEARRVVTAGFLANILLAVYSHFAIQLPAAPFWDGQSAFAATLGSTPRIVAASLVAYLVSSHLDISAYSWLSRRTAPWARVLLSNAVSLGFDTVLFIAIAFAGQMPLMPLIAGQYAVKMSVTVVSIPLIYLARYLYSRSELAFSGRSV